MLEKTYSPGEIEARVHTDWEAANAFKAGRPDRAGAETYCIVIPPPNVTGSLHIGHALNNTLQDILCRYQRMLGKDVLWQPGTDHAGIATQLVVSRQLAERQIHYKDLGRETFIEKVWEWKAQSGGTILNQLKRLGASCDWSRERFTMDEGLSKAVLKVFVDLYRQGLIYRDKRLVNWDPEFQSAISDLEVEQREHTGTFKWSPDLKDKEGNPVAFDGAALAKVLARDPNGHMYYIRYAIAGSLNEFVTVGTTRPETMLGDTGVAIHPDNEKLKHLIGKKAILPLVGREIPIVGDTYADPEKGTGAVKITPAHDFNDWDVGKRTGLEVINIMDATAKLNENAPEAYRGLDRFVARAKVVADLAALGVLEKIEPHTHAVPHAQRGDAVVEPWLTDQWYVDAATLAKPAMQAVRAGKTTFVPDKYAADYFRWLENIQPWCVSRQLWWGHQIPAWYGPDGKHFVAHDEAEAAEQAKKHYGESVALKRDEDVLDTWFSSALWPFSTLGWPEETRELGRFYPTSCLVTGFDIIFFWVARMMMMGTHFMKEVPFRDVFIHGLVRDEKGRKMSKTLGNVMDPLELIDKYGADALRFTLAALTTQGRDVKLTTARVEGYRNFATKLWNAARFLEMNECRRVAGFDPKKIKHRLNRWIAGETERAAGEIESALKAYKFNEAAGAAYQFVWGIFCDWYVELAKPLLTGADEDAKAETQAAAAWVLDQILPLLHPFIPFITEELWAKTGEYGPKRETLLALAPWPRLLGLSDPEADAEIGWVVSLVSEVRSVRAEMNVPAGAKVPLVLVNASADTRARAERHDETLKRLARLETITFEASAPKGAAQIVVGETVAALPLAGVIDMDAEAKRLSKEIDKTVSEIKKVTDRLTNPQFMAKAPEDVIDELRERQSDFEARQDKLKAALARVEAAA
ncbi:valine--tRNA ligase [Hyphomicrobium sp. CS1BSMeth3]|uniref:valine--tRNA ligase n=1 Tax=Hyphomicrobium sp. CS1BSMeth3 TaxID=1892844 RepID=UPI0009312D44|nr:valine--tRNA ligase [Hyphomicrobium sp. CS1BSMeth3]